MSNVVGVTAKTLRWGVAEWVTSVVNIVGAHDV